MRRLRSSLFALGIAGLVVLGVACGGGGGGGGDSNKVSESQAKDAAEKFLLSMFGIFTGDTKADEFLGQFAPECREGVNEDDIEEALTLISAFGGAFGELEDLEIEEFDIGEVTVRETEEGTLVAPKNLDSIRVKVDGKFVNADEYLQSVGFDEFGTDDPAEDPILMVRRDGKTYIGDCSFLEDFSGG